MSPFIPSYTYSGGSFGSDGGGEELAKRAVVEVFRINSTQRITLIVAASYVVLIGLLPYINWLIYPFKLLTVGMHELSHALAGVITCARIESIQLLPNEGGSTRMRGGIPAITLPAGYLGSSLIGAALVACGFDTSASKVAALVLFFLMGLILLWAWRSWVAWFSIAITAGIIIVCWLVGQSQGLRFFILFLGVMSCFYSIWDIIDDTLDRKVNTSDASEYANVIGCCGSRFWGAFWLIQSICFFVGAILVGIVAFKQDWETQKQQAEAFLGGSPGR